MNDVQIETIARPQPLNTLDAKALLNAKLPQVRYIVDELIPQGLHVLAGAPKIGKSFLTLWLCLQIAQGKPVWELESHKCGVLYISLEDTPERIKKRILQMTNAAPENFRLATSSNTITEGLAEQLEEYIQTYPDTGFIAIDTLQKVRLAEATQASSYAVDYMALSRLKAIADKHRIAILMVHHLRKQKSNDPFQMISGTTGITGAVDASYVMVPGREMKRIATLYAHGRDISYQEIDACFSNCVWQLIERRTPEQIDEDDGIPGTVAVILSVLDANKGFTGTISELLFLLDDKKTSPNIFSRVVKIYVDLFEEYGYRMYFDRSGSKRMIHFDPIPGYKRSKAAMEKLYGEGEYPQGMLAEVNDGDDDKNDRGNRHDDTAPANTVTIVTDNSREEDGRMESLILCEPPMEE